MLPGVMVVVQSGVGQLKVKHGIEKRFLHDRAVTMRAYWTRVLG